MTGIIVKKNKGMLKSTFGSERIKKGEESKWKKKRVRLLFDSRRMRSGQGVVVCNRACSAMRNKSLFYSHFYSSPPS